MQQLWQQQVAGVRQLRPRPALLTIPLRQPQQQAGRPPARQLGSSRNRRPSSKQTLQLQLRRTHCPGSEPVVCEALAVHSSAQLPALLCFAAICMHTACSAPLVSLSLSLCRSNRPPLPQCSEVAFMSDLIAFLTERQVNAEICMQEGSRCSCAFQSSGCCILTLQGAGNLSARLTSNGAACAL